MYDYLSMDYIAGEQILIALASLCYLVVSLAVGRLVRVGGLPGAAFGFLVLAAASNLALSLFLWLGIGLSWFGWAIAVIVATIAVPLRFVITGTRNARNGDNAFYFAIAVSVVCLFMAVNVITPLPAAGYNFYQAWNPLYVSGAFDIGHFPWPRDINLGEGFLTSGLWYGLDTLGLIALHTWVAGGQSGVAGMAASATASILTILVLLHPLRRDRVALLLFVFACLVFLRYGSPFMLAFANDWRDKLLPLASALAIVSVLSGNGASALVRGYTAAAFMVFARNYGAVIAVLWGAAFAATERIRYRRFSWGPWILASALLGVFTLRDVILVLNKGLFYPRISITALHPPGFAKSFWGTLVDWGLKPDPSVFQFGIPIGTVSILALAIGLFRFRQRRTGILLLLTPWLVLAGPLVLEAVTGYRKGVGFSKLYLCASWFFVWYPCFVLAATRGGEWLLHLRPLARWRHRLPWAALLSSVLLLVVAVGYKSYRAGSFSTYWKGATESYLHNNTDYEIYRQIMSLPEAERTAVVDRPILYLYYEPGIGLRYFLGGDFFDDRDFWSTPVQNVIADSGSLTEAWERLGCPNIYHGYEPLTHGYGNWVEYTAWRKLIPEIETLSDHQWIAQRIRVEPGSFYVTDPTKASSPYCR